MALAPLSSAWRPGAAGRFALLLWLTYAYFIPSPSWNPNSRFNLTLALAEHGQLHIDPYHHNTGDKARSNGHHYSDKAPGVSLLAVPAYLLFRTIWQFTGHTDGPRVYPVGRDGRVDAAVVVGDGEDDVLVNPAYRWGQYWATVFTSGLAAALVGALLLRLCAHWGQSPQQATIVGMGVCLGTLMFPYATTFYGHVVAGSLGFASFVVLAVARSQLSWQRLACSGALAGAAVACEWPAGLVAVGVGAYLLHALGLKNAWRAWAFALGASLPVALALAYNLAAFGGLFEFGYEHLGREDFAAGMGQGALGVSWPSPRNLLRILIGRQRGLLYASPLLILATWGLLRPGKRANSLPSRALALAITVSFLLLSAGYYMWWGGMALGPRHVIPALGFWGLGLLWALPPEPQTANEPRKLRWHRHVTFACLSLSILNMALGTAVGPEAPLTEDLLFRYVYPLAATGRIPAAHGASNWGRLLGLPGLLSLLPLAAIWTAYILRVWPLSLPPPPTPQKT